MVEQLYPDALPPQYRMHWYTVERVLGQGGFGITYLARDTNLDQLVALKEYLPVEVATRRPDLSVQARSEGQRERHRWGLDRFIQEARTLARFDHPSIVRVHSVFEFNGTAYMVMRFEEGENFGALLERRGTLPERELLRILMPILDGLELVHDAGFIHRDIKPDNIHIRGDGSPVLLDFGSARYALGRARTLTILVAPGYAPFEQYSGSSENQGPWTDIYGLGATFYRAIAGTAPLDAISRSKGILGSTREILVPATTIGRGRYSGRLLAAIDHALAFAEKDRPQSIAEWRAELPGEEGAASTALAGPKRTPASERAVAASHGVSAAPTLPPDTVRTAAQGAAPSGGDSAPSAKRAAARTPLAWAVAGAAAGAAAIAIFLRAPSPAGDAEQKLAELRQQFEQERGRLELQRKLDEEKRRQDEEQRKRDEQQKLAEAEKQRLVELDAMHKRDEEKSRKSEDQRKRRDEQQRQAEKERPAGNTNRREIDKRAVVPSVKPPSVASAPPGERPAANSADAGIAVAQIPAPAAEPAAASAEPAPSERSETSPAVAMAKPPTVAPTLNASGLLASADTAEARGDYGSVAAIVRPLAEGGNANAQFKLGELYANGRGVPRNYNQAYIWYSLAARAGNAAAAAGRGRMAAQLQPAEVRQADKLVANWRPR